MMRTKHALGLRPVGGTGFSKRSCLNKKIERDDDSKKSHPALVVVEKIRFSFCLLAALSFMATKKAADPAAFFAMKHRLLAEMPATVFATEPGSGLTNEAVPRRIAVVVGAVVTVVVGV
jgi:hypothetical protein